MDGAQSVEEDGGSLLKHGLFLLLNMQRG
jgi:hypothetical protein